MHIGSYTNNYVLCPGYLDVTVINNGESIGSSSLGWLNENNNFDPWGFFYSARMLYSFFRGIGTVSIHGNFSNTQSKFVGIKFLDSNNDTLYGYLELSNNVDPSSPYYITIHSYGYNSVPDAPVIAGDYSMLTSLSKSK